MRNLESLNTFSKFSAKMSENLTETRSINLDLDHIPPIYAVAVNAPDTTVNGNCNYWSIILNLLLI